MSARRLGRRLVGLVLVLAGVFGGVGAVSPAVPGTGGSSTTTDSAVEMLYLEGTWS